MLNTEYIRSLNANYERLMLGKTGRKKVPVLHDQPGRHQRIIALQSEIYRW